MEHRFDLFTKIFAGEGSRRDMIRRFGGLIAGASVVSVAACENTSPTSPRAPLAPGGGPSFQFDAPGRCRRNGRKCRESAECCSHFCDPTTGYCTCGPFSQVCPQTDLCVPLCPPPQVFNQQTCKCECGPNQETCGTERQGTMCCFTEFTKCCRPSDPGGFFSTCCPQTWTCCPTSFDAFCCPPTVPKCCTSPTSGFGTCCPADANCCINEFGNPVCVFGPCPMV